MHRQFILAVAAVVAVLATGAAPARADEIVFKNGDRLTGKVLSATGGKLKVATTVAGEVTVNLSTVRSFSTDNPVELRLADGTTLNERLEPAGDGTVRTSGAASDARTVTFGDIDVINPPPVKWTGSITAAAKASRGNTVTDSVEVRADAVRRSLKDRITLGGGYSFGREKNADTGDKNTTEDNWFTLGKYDFYLNKKLYLFALARVEKDRIADLDLRVAPGVGLGYQWFERPNFNLSTELGGGWIYEEYEDAGSDSHFTARAAYHVDKRFNDRVYLFHNLEFLPSVEDGSDYNVIADAGVRFGMTKWLFTEFKVEWQFDSTPAPDARKHDLKYLLSLGWQF